MAVRAGMWCRLTGWLAGEFAIVTVCWNFLMSGDLMTRKNNPRVKRQRRKAKLIRKKIKVKEAIAKAREGKS